MGYWFANSLIMPFLYPLGFLSTNTAIRNGDNPALALCVCLCVCVQCTRELRVTIVAGQESTVETNHSTKQRLVKHTDTHTHVEMVNAAEWLCTNNTGQQSATARDFSSP